MEEEGIVISVEGELAKVKVSRHSHCENCGSCPGTNAMIVDAYNKVQAGVNQRVHFRIQESNMLKSAFIIFILPLVSGASGYWLSTILANRLQWNGFWSGMLGAMVGFGLALLYIRRFDRHARSRGMLPVIERILED